MTDTSNVWLNADHDGRQLPSRAITDGSPAPVRVDARPFTYFRRLRVTLPVDAATARRIALADRCTLIAVILALSSIVFSLAILVLLIDALLTQRWPLIVVSTAVIPFAGGLAVIPNVVVRMLRPAQYPQVKPGGIVVIGAVDRAAANEWAALNPPGAVRLYG